LPKAIKAAIIRQDSQFFDSFRPPANANLSVPQPFKQKLKTRKRMKHAGCKNILKGEVMKKTFKAENKISPFVKSAEQIFSCFSGRRRYPNQPF
jgi:hypothetical protein